MGDELTDLLQTIWIGKLEKNNGTLEERVARLEKLVYELCLEIKKIRSVEEENENNKIRAEKKLKEKENQKFKLDDSIIFTTDIVINGNTIKKGTQGIIDNRLITSTGIQYIIKLKNNKSTVTVTDSYFKKEEK